MNTNTANIKIDPLSASWDLPQVLSFRGENQNSWVVNPRSMFESPDVIYDLERIVQKRVGFLSARRIRKFAEYVEGWDGEDAKVLSSGSAMLLAGFLNQARFPTTPSFFLTRAGHLALSWEDEEGEIIDVLFQEKSCQVERLGQTNEFPVFTPLDLQNIARAILG